MNDYGRDAHAAVPGAPGGIVASVDPASPADDAGIEPGMAVISADGHPLKDLIDWMWWTDGDELLLEVAIPVEAGSKQDSGDDCAQDSGDDCAQGLGDAGAQDSQPGLAQGWSFDSALLIRDPGQDWGIGFSDCVFDGMRECRNACVFCFITQLPGSLRPPLYLKDDDYRLSFLQGNYATLTNLTDEDFSRIVEQCISPLRVSLHAISPDVRQRLMGKNAQHGLSMLERILDAGLQVHAQIVLVPGMNDGPELERTLQWVLGQPGILSCGIVPLGYTRYQQRFSHSYEDPALAAEAIRLVEPYQERARLERGDTLIRLADEFYIDAGEDFPPACDYGSFEQFEDGIGMARSFIDGWRAACTERVIPVAECTHAATCITGEAFAPTLLACMAQAGLSGAVEVLPVHNGFLGGNVSVAGLLCAEDVAPALQDVVRRHGSDTVALLPGNMFNADGMTLDGCTAAGLAMRTGACVRVVPCEPMVLLDAILETLS